ncbi:hypothetical protein RIR_jg11810.t1 [Rhizophagus irregularis DAOM 181602=DAOM 197198]|uniref:Uncharacterized protein n=1 Tax=Rhizophagus irregularis (strain DAOM 181602 / DAOM 197198 / MUCL 43194) TaxID=747089 RepID=U9UEB5_RHIID|nr:hypothetical protein RIR_jg11810.t1 [Rhizophagus irregularis DAOM 181602=DAOM 197198]CAG8551147.1 19012_t:CDS:2 [Rhizophagus irregularis]
MPIYMSMDSNEKRSAITIFPSTAPQLSLVLSKLANETTTTSQDLPLLTTSVDNMEPFAQIPLNESDLQKL